MKHYPDIVHNTDEWYAARAGLATTSSFDKILTPGGKKSAQQDSYANQIIAELLLCRPVERNFDTYAMQWGREHEDQAANLYMFETGYDLEHGGFFVNDEMTRGSSPDAIVLDNGKWVGGAEIKCPENPTNHVEFLLLKEINPKYKPQVQGQMLVAEFEWIDWFSFYPGMPCNRITTHRDEDYIRLLDEALQEFEEKVQKKLGRLAELGHINEIPKKFMRDREPIVTEKPVDNLDELLMA